MKEEVSRLETNKEDASKVFKGEVHMWFETPSERSVVMKAVFFEEDPFVKVEEREGEIVVRTTSGTLLGLKRTLDDILSHVQVAYLTRKKAVNGSSESERDGNV